MATEYRTRRSFVFPETGPKVSRGTKLEILEEHVSGTIFCRTMPAWSEASTFWAYRQDIEQICPPAKSTVGPRVVYGSDSIALYDGSVELVYWDRQEWIDDPALTFAIAEAVRILYAEGPQAIRNRCSADEEATPPRRPFRR